MPKVYPPAPHSPSIVQSEESRKKRDLIVQTLSEDYPGLDYLGFHNVLNAKYFWYRVLWFTVVISCLLIGLYTIYRIICEYADNPSATLISVKSVEQLLLPQLTLCPTHAATLNLTKMEEMLFNNYRRISADDLLNFAYFMLAGSGFQKMKRLDAATVERMDLLYDRVRENRSVEEFFDYFFDNFGLQCHEFLNDCRLGDSAMDCCQIFTPIYLIRRGRCFRSVPLYQRNFDELGKLRVQLRQPFEMDNRLTTNQEVIAYVAEHKPQISPFPRYYLYPQTWTKMRISAKHISLFPAEEVCSEEYSAVGKDTCYIEKWLKTFLEAPLNCTYPYMHKLRQTGLISCDPLTILKNYDTAVETPNYTIHSCVLGCQRWEYTVFVEKTDMSMIYGKNATANLPYAYRIDLAYNDLQYESIEEVSTVTFAGLIAQIGGQAIWMSLFMGSSILNLIQATIMAIILLRRTAKQRGTARHDVNVNDLTKHRSNVSNSSNFENDKDFLDIPIEMSTVQSILRDNTVENRQINRSNNLSSGSRQRNFGF